MSIPLSTFNSCTAGRLKNFVSKWQTITSDQRILNAIRGVRIDFIEQPTQFFVPSQYNFNPLEVEIIDQKIDCFLERGIIEKTTHSTGEYISNVFIRPKKDGSHRLILNLKQLNRSVEYHHFKMENLKNAITLMTPNCFMATIDLKDAYYSVPVNVNHRKYLRFIWKNQLFQYTCLPNGLSSAPRLFTKILKPIYATLRSQGFENVGYIDDSYLQGGTFADCDTNVAVTADLFCNLGFLLNQEKSVFEPRQIITFLGFVLNSVAMTVALTPGKASKLVTKAKTILGKQSPFIREVSELIGLMVSSFPGVMHGPLFYRQLELDKAIALKANNGNFDAVMTLSDTSKSDLNWWITHTHTTFNWVSHGSPSVTIYSDASLTGWGGVMDGMSTGGLFSEEEQTNHINCLEILACFFTLKTFYHSLRNCHIRAMLDNTTAISYINNMGGRTISCNRLTRNLWLWCIERNLWITAAHIPGKLNVIADTESRKTYQDIEWKLDPLVFQKICSLWGKPSIDLFASRLNFQFRPFVSWKPDPEAFAIDAFSITWKEQNFYAFPPFAVINRVLQKAEQDQSHGLIIVPLWTTQIWFPRLLRMLVDHPVLLPCSPHLLTLPTNRHLRHPLHNKLKLMACRLSGILCEQEEFQRKLQLLSSTPGEEPLKNNTRSILKSGTVFAVKGF